MSPRRRLPSAFCLLPPAVCKKAPGEMIHRRLSEISRFRNCELVARTAAVATSAATTTASAIFAWLGFVNVQRASVQVHTIELLNRSRAFFLRRHLDKTKAA